MRYYLCGYEGGKMEIFDWRNGLGIGHPDCMERHRGLTEDE